MDLARFPVLEVISINGLPVPVLHIPMLKDKKRRHHISDEVLEKARKLQMTDRHRQIWDLYAMGVSMRVIAAKLGISPRSVEAAVYKTFEKLQGNTCKYAEDCFHCPMPDCVLSQRQAAFTNLLATDKYTSLWRK